mmetsp:Transcript_49402/g.137269  ORF Transcript_49402/g.137269 Transcript_49402/m.137269 type:complete len:209 (+) Transcript_49402:339-965(+)
MAHGRRCARGGPLGGDLGHRGRGGHLGRRDGEVAAAVASAYFHRLGRHAQVGRLPDGRPPRDPRPAVGRHLEHHLGREAAPLRHAGRGGRGGLPGRRPPRDLRQHMGLRLGRGDRRTLAHARREVAAQHAERRLHRCRGHRRRLRPAWFRPGHLLARASLTRARACAGAQLSWRGRGCEPCSCEPRGALGLGLSRGRARVRGCAARAS